ncbi:hypothetical protein BGW38_004164 [Lunasporangiospora selenospora]|uniref:Uncharacterized protein n=1 Tax=Lunasporangiospora selenospora TaxID=979761 RepID=A0A9P6G2F2_9FUNG|nr:hypothetical protein BGW38_004164 [Lunasporangiospora selenospora]
MISMFEDGKKSSTIYPDDLPTRPPGGFLFDPSLGTWANFTLSSDYRWGDSYLKPNSFILFRPRIDEEASAGSGGNSINIGLLPNDGSFTMVNWEQWELSPVFFGYPVLLAFAKKSLFQLGTKIEDNRTGDRKFYLTRIPIRDNFTFSPTNDYPVIPLPGFTCDADSLAAKPYRDSLYILCLTPPNWFVMIKDEDGAEPTIGRWDIQTLELFQPIGGDLPGQGAFLYCPARSGIQGLEITASLPLRGSQYVSYSVNITDDFGFEQVSWGPPPNLSLIIGGTVAGVILVALVILYRPIKRRWPRWKAQWRRRLLEQISSDADLQGDHRGNPSKETGKKQSSELDPKESAKIEIPSRDSSKEFEGQDKILVTCDEDLAGAMNLAEPLTGVVSGRFADELNLEHHPRPTVVTNYSQNDVRPGSSSTSSSSRDPSPPRPNPAVLGLPPTTVASGKERPTLLVSLLPSKQTPSTLPSAPPVDPSDYPVSLRNHQPLTGQTIPYRWESSDIPSTSSSNSTDYTLTIDETVTLRPKMTEEEQITEDVDGEDVVPPYVEQSIIPAPPPVAFHSEQHPPSAPPMVAVEGVVPPTTEQGPIWPSTIPSTDSSVEQISRIGGHSNNNLTIQGE